MGGRDRRAAGIDVVSELDRHLAQARAAAARAMDDRASAGSTQMGVLEAGVRASLDYGLKDLKRDLGRAEDALGHKIDAGSFLLGMCSAGFAISGVDIVEAIRTMPHVFVEYVEKARSL